MGVSWGAHSSLPLSVGMVFVATNHTRVITSCSLRSFTCKCNANNKHCIEVKDSLLLVQILYLIWYAGVQVCGCNEACQAGAPQAGTRGGPKHDCGHTHLQVSIQHRFRCNGSHKPYYHHVS